MSQENLKTILVIEDDKDARDILIKKLASENFKVVQAKNGEEGLHQFDAEKPSLIVLDLYMPVMDGHVFLEKLRGHPQGAETPVIVLSNWVTHDFVINAFDKQLVDYLLKTDTALDVVVSKIKKTLGLI